MSFRRSPSVFIALALVLSLAPALAAGAAPGKETLSPREAKRRDAVAHFLRARLLAADSEFEEALKEFRRAVDLDPEDGNLRREYAEVLRDLAVWPEAEQQARKAVELAPTNPGAHRVLGQVLLATAKEKKALEEAAAELKKANFGMPADPIGASSYAQALLRLDKAADAVPVLERVLDRGRGSAIPLLYGEALERSGQLERAEDLYSSILRQEPENRAASVGLLRVYERQRRFDKAIPVVEGFQKAQPENLALKTQYGTLLLRARRFADASRVFQEVLKADPGNRDALRHWGTLLSETRETDKADEVLKRLQGLDTEDLDVPFRRALNFIEARRIPEAEKVLLELREKVGSRKGAEGELAQVDGQLAYCSFLRKDWEGARARLRPHLWSGEGLNTQAFNLLLQIARETEDFSSGLSLAREAAAKEKHGPAVRAALGEFLLRSFAPEEKAQGEKLLAELAREERAGALAAADAWQRLEKFEKAAAVAREALETYREDPDLLFRLAASLEREKKIAESVAAFEKLIEVREDHAAGLNYLGYLWADRGENLQRALKLIQKAVDLDPTNGAYLDSLGWVYFQLNDLARAEEYLRAAQALNPDDSAIEEHIGDLYERRGDLARARESWKRALRMKPEEGGKKLEEKLRRTEGKAGASRK